jgi:uncharacterized protein YukJ
MPIQNYSLLKGDPTSGKVVSGNSPHYQIQVQTADGETITVAVNIQSVDGSEVLYLIDSTFQPDNEAVLTAQPTGLQSLPSTPGGLALDYVRSTVGGRPMVTKSQMSLLPTGTGIQNDLHNQVVDLLNQAVADANGTIYAFGSAYSDPGGVQGIHDIHMNQGNPVHNHSADNGVWQDGAIFINLPASQTWTAVFIAFQTESWTTDDTTGNPV